MARRRIYRDKDSGRFVSKSKWTRSHGQQGKYVSESVKVRTAPKGRVSRAGFTKAHPRLTRGVIEDAIERAQRLDYEQFEGETQDLGEEEY